MEEKERRLHFPTESFFHLAGLQHLTDIVFSSTNKERIYKDILDKKLTIDYIKKSEHFEKKYIEERLLDFFYMESLLDSNSVAYLINGKRYAEYTSIKADYLCERKVNLNIIYMFWVRERARPRFPNECKGCSLFTKHDIDFSLGASKTTTLLIEKIVSGEVMQLYRNPSYKENEGN